MKRSLPVFNADDGPDMWVQVQPPADTISMDKAIEAVFEEYGLPKLGGASGRGWSWYSTMQKCWHLYRRKFIDGDRYKPGIAGPALEVGVLLHALLAVYYSQWITEGYPLSPLALHDGVMKMGALPDRIANAWRLMEAYEIRYEQDYFRPLAVEEWAADPVTGNSCRYDAIVEVTEPPLGMSPGVYICEHKCQVGETLVLDGRTGQRTRLDVLAARGAPARLPAFVDGKILWKPATVQPESVRDVYRVTTKNGRVLRTSDNHPFLTARGWIPAASLTNNDFVAIPETTRGLRPVGSAFTDAQVAFVGYMLGDGTLSSLTFTKNDECVLSAFQKALDDMGVAYTTARYEGKAPYVRVSQVKDGPAQVLVQQLGLRGRAVDKHVPDAFFDIGDDQIGVLLGALWSTDGCIDVFEERAKNRTDIQQKVRIAYASRSERLCKDIQHLLLRLGVESSTTRSSVGYRGGRRDYWTTKVVGREAKRRFLVLGLEGVFPLARHPASVIKDVLDSIKPGDDRDIPTELIYANVDIERAPARLRAQLKVVRSVERAVLRGYADEAEVAVAGSLRRVCDMQVRWDRVSTVIVDGREMMYDVTVPDVHNFVANDIITHNTASRFDATVTDGWRNDGEVIGQMMLWESSGMLAKYGECQGVIVNMLGKQKIPQFTRIIVPPQAWQLDSHARELKIWRAMEAMNAATNTWPRSRANCVTKFGFCDFFEECANQSDVADPTDE
jgi:intein/homing endonuclease